MNREEARQYIFESLGVEHEVLWMQYPDYWVFRHPRNKKWFGIMMDIEKEKLGLDGEGKQDILVLKSDPILIGSLLHNDGYLPAYHMHKKTWITVLLSDKVGKDEMKDIIHLAYDLIDKKK